MASLIFHSVPLLIVANILVSSNFLWYVQCLCDIGPMLTCFHTYVQHVVETSFEALGNYSIQEWDYVVVFQILH